MKESRTTPSLTLPGATDILDYTYDVAGSPTVDRRNAYYATRAPGATDNSDTGFKRGSVWIFGDQVYVCTNSDPSQTQWSAVSGGGGGGIPDAPSDNDLYARKDGAWELAASPVFDFYYDATITYDGTANTASFLLGDIPSSYATYNTDLTRLYLGNSVTTIGDSAFVLCSGLTGNLVIPNSVTSIGGSAFGACSGLTGNLVIPNSVTSIGGSAFGNCNGFTGNLVIPNSVTSIEYGTFSSCSSLSGNLTIPNSVTSIGSYAFYVCSSFTGNLTIPNSVTSIGSHAFKYCAGFTGNLVIPNSVTSIGSEAFAHCTNLTSAYLNQPIGNIGSSAFYYSGITDIYIGPSATGYTLGAGQTIGGATVTVSLWTNYPNVP